jgi:hypothetical protein
VKLHLPYYAEKTNVSIRGEVVEVKAFQIIVWVSVSIPLIQDWDANIPRIPAILDIGNNHNFALSEEQMVRWAGLQPASLKLLKVMREKGERVPLHSASLWIHTDADPFRLNVKGGIAVYESGAPRLPIFGPPSLTNNKPQTFIYGDTKQVLIRTPPKWYWPF